MRILGVDPGLNRTGYGLVEVSASGPGLLEAGIIDTDGRLTLSTRLHALYAKFVQVLSGGRPAVIVIEDLFTHPRFPRTAIVMGHVCGVLHLAAAQAGIPIEAIPPASVKRALVTSGRAGKGQVQRMVRMLLALAEEPRTDVADALALALVAMSRRGLPLTRPASLRGPV
jgi:crossover junction endodeoxyribonuclease RuvC